MIVEGKMVPPVVESALEEWMLANSFTYGQAITRARALLEANSEKVDSSDRLADRMIQRLRKGGKIAWKRVNGHVTWSVVR